MSRFTFAEVLHRPKRLHAWWIEFPPRRFGFYQRRHPEYLQWGLRWYDVALVVLMVAAVLGGLGVSIWLLMQEQGI